VIEGVSRTVLARVGLWRAPIADIDARRFALAGRTQALADLSGEGEVMLRSALSISTDAR
jgi:hypothetical protein